MTAQAEFATIAERLLARLPELTGRVCHELLESEAAYRAAVPRAELQEVVQESLGQILEHLTGAADSFDGLVERAGERRAHQGVPLESLVRAAHLDFRILWREMREEARACGVGDDVMLGGVAMLWEIIDGLTTELTNGHRRGEIELNRLNEQRRNDLFDCLIEGRGSEPALARQAAATLELPEHGPFAVVAVAGESRDGMRSSPALTVSSQALRRAGMRWAWRHRADHSLGLVALGPRGIGALAETLRDTWEGQAGVSPAFAELSGTAGACEFAELTLRSLPRGSAAVALLDERLLEALVATNERVAGRLAERTIGCVLALPEPERDRLLETLEVYLETGGSVSACGERLYCHRNTVLQRLRRIRELTGLSPRDARSTALLYLALEARR